MEKKDYLSLQSKYSFLTDYQKRYHKELLDFINEAFEKHGNEFKLKPEGCNSWEERRKEEDFYAMDELPYYLDIGVENDNAHETHISRVRQIERGNYKAIEVDGWDWCRDKWVEGCEIFYNIDSLKAVADFINAVLEQESGKFRTFKQGERVFNCEYSENDRDLHDWARVCRYTEVEEEDAIVLIQMDDGSENETTAGSLYQIAEGKSCPRCGGPLCIEHHDEIDYPYFCPWCQENFYGIEVQ